MKGSKYYYNNLRYAYISTYDVKCDADQIGLRVVPVEYHQRAAVAKGPAATGACDTRTYELCEQYIHIHF